MSTPIKPPALTVTIKVYRRTCTQVSNTQETIVWTLIDNRRFSVPSDGHFISESICKIVNGYIEQHFAAYSRVFDDRITTDTDLYIEGSHGKFFGCTFLKAPK